ncbi:MAG TPA: hypothetical protein GXX29_06535 [Firmicutes bacterium]|nr:hypothetical protein [Bacillota bacterium]
MQDIAIPFWIQHANYQTEDRPPTPLAAAIEFIKQYDWESELEIMRQLERAKKDFCPPGIGFVPGDGRILHIWLDEPGQFQVHYSYKRRIRLFSLTMPAGRKASAMSENMSLPKLADAVTLFYKDEHDRLLALL